MLPNNTKVVTRSATELVSVEEIREHLLLFGDTSHDEYIIQLTFAAQQLAENYIGEFLTTTTVRHYYPSFSKTLSLPNRFTNSITSVTYRDEAGLVQTVDSSNYVLDDTGSSPQIRFSDSYVIPSLSSSFANPVSADVVCGVDSTNAPEFVKQAILLYTSELFNNREGYIVGTSIAKLPLASERLLSPLKRNVL